MRKYFKHYVPLTRHSSDQNNRVDNRNILYEVQLEGSLYNVLNNESGIQDFIESNHKFNTSALAVIACIFKVFQSSMTDDSQTRVIWVNDRLQFNCWAHLVHLAYYAEAILGLRATKGRETCPATITLSSRETGKTCRVDVWFKSSKTKQPNLISPVDAVVLDRTGDSKSILPKSLPNLAEFLNTRAPTTYCIEPDLSIGKF